MIHSMRFVFAFVVLLVGIPGSVMAEATAYGQNRGRIVFQASAFSDFSTEKAFVEAMRKARRNKNLARGPEGGWPMHFVAFLKKPPGAKTVNLVWYRRAKRWEQVDYVEYVVPPGERVLKAKAVLSSEQFKAGDKLEARITRLVKGRERVLARVRLTLK